MITLLIFLLGYVVGFFLSSVYFQFIIEEIRYTFMYGDIEYEKQKQDKN